MEFFSEWKFWLFGITVIGIIINWLANHKLMNNHLRHLSSDLKDIKKKQEEQGNKINNIETEVAFIKGRTKIKN